MSMEIILGNLPQCLSFMSVIQYWAPVERKKEALKFRLERVTHIHLKFNIRHQQNRQKKL